jgi:hypothetical protein
MSGASQTEIDAVLCLFGPEYNDATKRTPATARTKYANPGCKTDDAHAETTRTAPLTRSTYFRR